MPAKQSLRNAPIRKRDLVVGASQPARAVVFLSLKKCKRGSARHAQPVHCPSAEREGDAPDRP